MPTVDVLDSTMAYLDDGAGTPIVFLHGNPTSSYVWRKVWRRLGRPGRLLAPDLIGMGASGKPPSDYRFADHARYLDAWFDALGLDRVVLVGFDWGGALALDRARRHPDQVLGIAFFETIIRPMTWDEFPPAGRSRFEALRTPGVGEDLALDRNAFITDALPRTTLTELTPADLAAYAAPYPTPESRRPLLAWPRSMPIDGEPADVVAAVEAYDEWLATSPSVPKLLLTFDPQPTLMIDEAAVAWCREHISGLEVAGCGAAAHVAPEDRPDEIADALLAWTGRHRLLAAPPGTGTLIRTLADRAELADLVARHSLWIDEARYAETHLLFTEDVEVTSPRGQAHGIEALVDLVRRGHDTYLRTLHSKSNLVVDVDGDTATVRAHDLAVFVIDDETEAVAAGFHTYRARRTADGWRFDRLAVTPIALTGALDRAL